MGSYFSRPFLSDLSQIATKLGVDEVVPSYEDAQEHYKTYDYVIVGGGATGCVLANRLSEDANKSVLLIEAGGNNRDALFSKIPIGFGKLFRTKWDWAYYTVPQSSLGNRQLFWPRGKMLGGSTSINAMLYHHCSPSDFDEWEQLGAKGWSYAALAPYLRKAEKFTPDTRYPDVKVDERGDSGLWLTSYTWCSEMCQRFIDAGKQIGIPYTPDFNTQRGTLGASKLATFIDSTGSRSSSATAYLSDEVVARKNLTISVLTTATRVLLSSDAKPRAVGLEIAKTSSSPRFRVAARREVILSAGALATPALLNLSGIGARDELEKHGVSVIKDLPAVGKNLSDHLWSGTVTLRAKKGISLDFLADPLRSLPSLIRWFWAGTGPATHSVAEAAAFVRSTDPALPFTSKISEPTAVLDTTSGPAAPDLEILTAPVTFLDHGFGSTASTEDCLSIAPILLRPLSTGSVYLTSASPFEKAAVDPNYFSDPNDMRVLVRGLRLSLRIARQEPLRELLLLKDHSDDEADVFWPGDADPDLVTDDALERWIRANAETLYHPVGTAKIGLDAADSVVDAELKVHGVDALRVIDASIFPAQLSGHPTAPLIAIGEKASEMIVHDNH
ncbi:hypothetical protein PLICRDRAFT_648550 [Plicaturopsis crispa FD-325 SS-3]|nr:hypothetical protein PLICRDRAFT_648550 [Plicaturopsis crispa FD-325 SS-3]